MSNLRRWIARLSPALGLSLAMASQGCALFQRGGRDPVDRALRRADAIYKKRADPEQFEAAIQAYLDALGLAPDDPRVLGRLTQSYVLHADLGLADPLTDYATAREFGLRCLSLQPAFSGQVTAAGGRVTKKAVAQLQNDQLRCLTETSIAWSRLALARGPGMALDFDAIDALGARALELSGPDSDGRAALARGLSLAVVPRVMGPELDEARAQLEAAAAKQPERLAPRVDLAVHGLHRLDKPAERRALEAAAAAEITGDGPEHAEDRAARARARRQLGLPPAEMPGEGLPDPLPAEGEPGEAAEGEPSDAAEG